jgi:hypothetical protein
MILYWIIFLIIVLVLFEYENRSVEHFHSDEYMNFFYDRERYNNDLYRSIVAKHMNWDLIGSKKLFYYRDYVPQHYKE